MTPPPRASSTASPSAEGLAPAKHAEIELLATETRDFFPESERPASWDPQFAPLPIEPEPWRRNEARARLLDRFAPLYRELTE